MSLLKTFVIGAFGISATLLGVYAFSLLPTGDPDAQRRWAKRTKSCKRNHKEHQGVNLKLKRIVIVESDDQWNEVYPVIVTDLQHFKTLGFDAEWVSQNGKRNPVALVQLATISGLCVLVRLKNETLNLNKLLRELLSDKSVLKLGVGCGEDAKKLFIDYNMIVRGCVDLRMVAARVREIPQMNYGLGSLCEQVTGVQLDKKNNKTRTSDWEIQTLTPDQINYAAMDALAGIRIFEGLLELKYGSDIFNSHQLWSKVTSLCQGIVDTDAKSTMTKTPNQNSNKMSPSRKRMNDNKEVSGAYSARTKSLYHNCQLLAPDGQLLCTCDVKKAHWYIEKELGDKICDDPLTIKLRFEPSGRPSSERNYYLKEKANICVVCGIDKSYVRKNVIPHEYRKHFPSVMKDHRSHDVVLLCTRCHQRSSQYDSVLKMQLAKQYNAIEAGSNASKYQVDSGVEKIISASRALIKSADKLPEARRLELENLVKNYFAVDELDEDILNQASKLQSKTFNKDFVAHGEKVVLEVMQGEGLLTFEKKWRQHFVDTMQPKFLPELWSVNHSHERLSVLTQEIQNVINEDTLGD